MKADTYSLQQVFGLSTRYVVPLYQRPYVWEQTKQWEPLWDDIRELAERLTDSTEDNDDVPHFMGAIVLAQTWGQIDKSARLVIDGQQRLTTLQLLMAAVRDVAIELQEPAAEKRMDSLLLIDDYLVDDPELRYKLVPTNTDRVAFRRAITGMASAGKPDPDARDQTWHAYRYFHDAVRQWALDEGDAEQPGAKLRALAKGIRELIRIVVIDLEPRDNAQAIFETLNARGQPLLAADLVKNFLFQRAEAERQDVQRLYDLYWKPFDLKPWRSDMGQGRARRPRIDVFLTHWLTMKSVDEVSWQHLFDDFRRWYDKNPQPIEQLLADLTENARIFEGFDSYPVGSPEQLFFYRIGVLEAATAFPVILWLHGPRGIQDPDDRRVALRVIESWLVRRMLRRLTTKNHGQVLLTLLKHLATVSSPTSATVAEFFRTRTADTQEWPADEALLESLRTQPFYTSITRARLRMVLEALEADLRGALVGPFTAWGALSIEHVLPQEWHTHWPLPPDTEELRGTIERDTAKHRLGNLSLVTHPLNSSLSNAPWTADPGQPSKREALREFNVLMLNKPLVDLDHWDEASIAARTESLAKRVLAIWPGPSAVEIPVPAIMAPEPTTDAIDEDDLPDDFSDYPASLDKLAEDFHLEMVDLYKRARAEAHYNAGIFLSMLSDIGGYRAAQVLLRATDPSDGYVALWERGRLDLTVEAAVVRPDWAPLFTDEERTTARERLEAYGFDVDGWLQTIP